MLGASQAGYWVFRCSGLTIRSTRNHFVPAKCGTEKRATFCLHYAVRVNSGVRRPMKISAYLVLIGMLIPTICHGGELRPAKLIAPLNDQSAIDGCSWSASSHRTGKGFIFLAEYDESRVLMNIAGTDTELQRISTRGHLKKLGSVATSIYRSKSGTIVYATYQTTWLCPKDDASESCEVTKFNATYEVSTGTRHQVINATGSVGC